MGRPIASVHIDIAEFVLEVSEVPGGDAGLAAWVRSLVRCLGKRDPALHEYGGRLLVEAAKYASDVSEQRRQAANAKWEKINGNQGNAPASTRMQTHATASHSMQTHATEQSSTEQIRSGSNPPLSPPGGEKVSADFEAARKAFPGVKRGYAVEHANFLRQLKKFRLTPSAVLPLLLPAVTRYKAHGEKKARQDKGAPMWQHFKTWVNNQGWTAEYPGEEKAVPKVETAEECSAREAREQAHAQAIEAEMREQFRKASPFDQDRIRRETARFTGELPEWMTA